jgi:hypothetical protein
MPAQLKTTPIVMPFDLATSLISANVFAMASWLAMLLRSGRRTRTGVSAASGGCAWAVTLAAGPPRTVGKGKVLAVSEPLDRRVLVLVNALEDVNQRDSGPARSPG